SVKVPGALVVADPVDADTIESFTAVVAAGGGPSCGDNGLAFHSAVTSTAGSLSTSPTLSPPQTLGKGDPEDTLFLPSQVAPVLSVSKADIGTRGESASVASFRSLTG
ncbi:unnamed protein product, partial [Discosporangium mesarthrocarpum]